MAGIQSTCSRGRFELCPGFRMCTRTAPSITTAERVACREPGHGFSQNTKGGLICCIAKDLQNLLLMVERTDSRAQKTKSLRSPPLTWHPMYSLENKPQLVLTVFSLRSLVFREDLFWLLNKVTLFIYIESDSNFCSLLYHLSSRNVKYSALAISLAFITAFTTSAFATSFVDRDRSCALAFAKGFPRYDSFFLSEWRSVLNRFWRLSVCW